MATLVNTNPQTTTTNNPPGTTPYQISPDASGLLGPNLTGAANQLYAAPNVNPAEASAAVNDLFGTAETTATDTSAATAQGIVAQGDTAEANAYLSASSVADQNASLVRASTGIQQAQEDRQVQMTLGAQGADIAGAGFGGGTSAMSLFADSAHQGALSSQLIGVQGALNAGGFKQQSLAAQAEATAAQGAAGAAGVLAGQDTQTAADLQIAALNGANMLIDTAGTGTAGTGAAGSNTGASAFQTLQQSMIDPRFAAASYVGHSGAGMQPGAFMSNGGAPQAPSPFLTNPGGIIGTAGGTPIANVKTVGGMSATLGTS